MAGMGPAPKPEAQRKRRNATVATTQLPSEGRRARAPKWPLIPDVQLTVRHRIAEGKVEKLRYDINELEAAGKPVGDLERRLDRALEVMMIAEAQLAAAADMEQELWRDLWKLPQATMWERLRWTRDVAQYVRYKVLAELGDLNSGKEARQYSDRLGLNPLAMLRLRWSIVEDETALKRNARASAGGTPAPAKEPARDPFAALRVV